MRVHSHHGVRKPAFATPRGVTMAAMAAATGVLALAGCTVGPDYRPPSTPRIADARFVSHTGDTTRPDPLPARWWALYNDPVIDRLVPEALAANTDLRQALARLDKARAVLSETRGDRLPQTRVSAGGRVRRGDISGAGDTGLAGSGVTAGNPADDGDTHMAYAGGFDVSYELDLFGRVTREIEAARADAQARKAAVDGVRVMVAAETTRAYLGACTAAERIAVATNDRDVAARTLAVVRERVRLGAMAPEATDRFAAQERAAAAAIAPLQNLRRAALFNLALLMGKPPAQVDPAAAACTRPPALDKPVPTGDGRELLARRPDVREAERKLAAQTAGIGVATADLYPRIAIGGSLLSNVTGLGDAGSKSGLSFALGPLLSWSFPNVQKARARIAQAKAGTREALAAFDGTWLRALNETERALTGYATATARNAALRDRAARERSVWHIVQASARLGATRPLALLDAERTYLAARGDLARSDAQVLDRQVTLFKALGGGWRLRGSPDPQASARPGRTNPVDTHGGA